MRKSDYERLHSYAAGGLVRETPAESEDFLEATLPFLSRIRQLQGKRKEKEYVCVSVQAEFLALFLKHEGDLRAFIGSLVRDRNGCEDILQEVALTAWSKFDAYDRGRSFGAWARGIAANKIMKRREQFARSPVLFSPETVQAVLDACDRAESRPLPKEEALEACIETLPRRSRGLLALRYEESLDLQQIADRLQSTVMAIHKALWRLRQRLRECVESRLAAARERLP
ncbi:MAG TPA: sigma-70 family RNA polymerase sigma factor [Pirellulaceae bacterium]|nr:sigma-70 family RNA polymerase sigma factor [Pirellulaceae bacterium]